MLVLFTIHYHHVLCSVSSITYTSAEVCTYMVSIFTHSQFWAVYVMYNCPYYLYHDFSDLSLLFPLWLCRMQQNPTFRSYASQDGHIAKAHSTNGMNRDKEREFERLRRNQQQYGTNALAVNADDMRDYAEAFLLFDKVGYETLLTL